MSSSPIGNSAVTCLEDARVQVGILKRDLAELLGFAQRVDRQLVAHVMPEPDGSGREAAWATHCKLKILVAHLSAALEHL